jgi:hypothetical protein
VKSSSSLATKASDVMIIGLDPKVLQQLRQALVFFEAVRPDFSSMPLPGTLKPDSKLFQCERLDARRYSSLQGCSLYPEAAFQSVAQ